MKRAGTKKKDAPTGASKGSDGMKATFEGQRVSKAGESLKLPDRAVADAQQYDDMERNFEKVSSFHMLKRRCFGCLLY